MRRPIRLLLATAAVAALSGCAQTGRMASAFPWSTAPAPSTAGKSAVVTDPANEAAEKDAKEQKPAASDAGKDKDTAEASAKADDKPAAVAESKPAEKSESDEKSKSTEPAKSDPGALVHDAKTLALIDEELKQVTPQERDKLFAEWKTLDSAMVQQVIRIRRMVRELESADPASVAATATLPGATTNPWGVNANAAAPPARVDTNPDSVPSATTDAAEGVQVASTLPLIEPAGHSRSAAADLQSTAAYRQTQLLADAGAPPRDEQAAPATTDAPSEASATPPAAGTPDDWDEQLRQLIAVAEARAEQAHSKLPAGGPENAAADAAARQRYVESQVQLRLLYLMAGDQARAMQAIPDIDAADQQFWQQVLWGVSNYFDEAAQPDRADRMTHTVEQLRTAVTRLQGEANLQLRNVAFCRKITSFGNFERFDRDEYTPGQRVLLYAEVVNFKSVPQAHDGLYKTQLTSTVEILRSGQSQPLTKIAFDPTVDLCRSYRQDYFHSYELKIPEELNVGDYVLKLTVVDNQSGKQATYTLNFSVK